MNRTDLGAFFAVRADFKQERRTGRWESKSANEQLHQYCGYEETLKNKWKNCVLLVHRNGKDKVLVCSESPASEKRNDKSIAQDRDIGKDNDDECTMYPRKNNNQYTNDNLYIA